MCQKDTVKISFSTREGLFQKKEMSFETIVKSTLKEIIQSHDNLYKSVWYSLDPEIDIAAKNARALYNALKNNIPLEEAGIQIDEEFLEERKAA